MPDFDPFAPAPSAAPAGVPRGRPVGVAARFAGLAAVLFSVVWLISLLTYHATDIPWLSAPTGSVANGLGRAGAYLAWLTIALFGLPAFLAPVATGVLGFAAASGKRCGWRPLWALLLLPGICALVQPLAASLAGPLSSPRLNAAPNPGGGIGSLLYGPEALPCKWIGNGGALALYGILAAICLVLLLLPSIAGLRRNRAIRREIIAAAEDRTIGEPTDLEADDLAAASSRRSRREAARAAKDDARAEREERIAAERAAKQREREEREAERARLKAEKAAEKQREKEEREAERQRRREEREAARAARRAGHDPDDIFAPGAAAATTADPAPSAGAPDLPAPQPTAPAMAAPAAAAQPAAVPQPAAARAPLSPALHAAVSPAPESLYPQAEEGPDLGPFPPSPITFHLPTTRLLNALPPDSPEDNHAEIEERSKIIEGTLGEFGLNGTVTHVVCGPTITRYEVKPESGVKVTRIEGVHSNLQMNLRAKSLRIIAPIPGKDVVGLEVPNLHSRPVPLRGIAESPEWKAAERKMALPMLLSRDIDGSPVIADLAKMPHMIVAGTTGSGKSVTLNAILAGWLLSRTPDQLRLVLVDPKRVEFTPYADIPHLVVPVITEAPKVAVCLQWAVKEMERRLKLFQKVGVRNIGAFNTRCSVPRQTSLFGDEQATTDDGAPPTLPYIAIVIDEMSDLMMLAGADVEPRVVRLAQLARAAGIHLIIATQRPDVKVITGKIKANFPARIALKVASAVDSITILDQAGAQTLIGRGDMLFLNPSSTEGVTRSQSCWIDDGEIAALTKWYRDQGDPMYVREIKDKLDRIKVKDAGDDSFKTFESEDSGDSQDSGAENGGGEHAFLQRCLDTLVAADRASTSMLQRKLRLGYNKAARVIDQLEQLGCLGPANGAAPRDILRTTVPSQNDGDDSSGAPDEAQGDDDEMSLDSLDPEE